MAISKTITAPNGVPLTYHRVVSLNIIKGVQNVIEVGSYISAEARAAEAAAIEAGEAEMNVYIESSYVGAPYDPDMTLTGAYEHIKNIEPYVGSEDVFEDGNDPVAVAMSEARDGNLTSELVTDKPADKDGYETVPVIESLGYQIGWEFVPESDGE